MCFFKCIYVREILSHCSELIVCKIFFVIRRKKGMTIRVNFYPFKILIKKSFSHLFKFSLFIYDTMHIWYVFLLFLMHMRHGVNFLLFLHKAISYILYKSAKYNFLFFEYSWEKIACVIFFFKF